MRRPGLLLVLTAACVLTSSGTALAADRVGPPIPLSFEQPAGEEMCGGGQADRLVASGSGMLVLSTAAGVPPGTQGVQRLDGSGRRDTRFGRRCVTRSQLVDPAGPGQAFSAIQPYGGPHPLCSPPFEVYRLSTGTSRLPRKPDAVGGYCGDSVIDATTSGSAAFFATTRKRGSALFRLDRAGRGGLIPASWLAGVNLQGITSTDRGLLASAVDRGRRKLVVRYDRTGRVRARVASRGVALREIASDGGRHIAALETDNELKGARVVRLSPTGKVLRVLSRGVAGDLPHRLAVAADGSVAVPGPGSTLDVLSPGNRWRRISLDGDTRVDRPVRDILAVGRRFFVVRDDGFRRVEVRAVTLG